MGFLLLQCLAIQSLAIQRSISFSDVLGLSEMLTKDFSLTKQNAISIAEDFIKIYGTRKQETIQISEGRKHLYGLQNTESILFSEALIKEASKQHIESIIFSELLSSSSAFQRSILESLSAEENITTSVPSFKVISDLLTVNEIIKKDISIPKNEILIISEENIKDLGKNVLENLTIEELFQRESVYFVDLIDETSLAEILIETHGVLFSDAFTLSDLISTNQFETLGGVHGQTIMKTKKDKTILLSGRNVAIIKTKRGKTILLTK